MRIIFKRNGQLECAEVSRIFSENGHLCLDLEKECVTSKTSLPENKIESCIKTVCQNGEIDIHDIDFASKKTVFALNRNKKYSTHLIDITLSPRAYNCLVRYMDNLPVNRTTDNPLPYTLKDVYINTPFLKLVRNCGQSTAEEIANVFESFGFDVTHWRTEIKSWGHVTKCRLPEELENERIRLWQKLEAEAQSNAT